MPWYHFCYDVLHSVLFSNFVFLFSQSLSNYHNCRFYSLQIVTCINTQDDTKLKTTTSKICKQKFTRYPGLKTVLFSSTSYIFALYTCFSFTREVLINYDHVINQKKPQTLSRRTNTWWIPLQEGRGIERWSIPPSRHNLLFHGSLKSLSSEFLWVHFW